MFCGIFESNLDNNKRLAILVGLGDDICGDYLVLKEGLDDCLEIHTEAELILPNKQPEELFVVKCDKDKRRIKIPANLLDSKSFYLGKKVTLVGKGSYIRILPRP